MALITSFRKTIVGTKSKEVSISLIRWHDPLAVANPLEIRLTEGDGHDLLFCTLKLTKSESERLSKCLRAIR